MCIHVNVALHGGKIAGNTQLALMRIEFNKDGKFGECAHLLFFVALFTASSLLHGSIETSRLTFLYDSHITRRLDFKEMTSMNAQYPAILFPAFRMQNSMMNAVMGERWWLKKKGVRFPQPPPPPSPTPTPALESMGCLLSHHDRCTLRSFPGLEQMLAFKVEEERTRDHKRRVRPSLASAD